ncbi:MAG TPA: DNA alkylation repair protein [Balneolales bacterium]|nr:DNA alkylation repair protein [Balneolales bacterium]
MPVEQYTLEDIRLELQKAANPKIASFLQGFFKTGRGQYGEGDQFRGIKVPVIRKIVRKARSLSMDEVISMLDSSWHEDRLLALFVWVYQFEKAGEAGREKIFRAYLDHSGHINNWDLVDLSTPTIMGGYLFNRDRSILYEMARSNNLWDRRKAVMATSYFIRNNDFDDTLSLAEILLHDSEDLIHKAVGWMLREIGKRDSETEESFLKKYYKDMSRTMLRYAIERFPEESRQAYLKGRI